ncbi:hypothetical protein Trydic_g597 [Trypoxylus dichotomus]
MLLSLTIPWVTVIEKHLENSEGFSFPLRLPRTDVLQQSTDVATFLAALQKDYQTRTSPGFDLFDILQILLSTPFGYILATRHQYKKLGITNIVGACLEYTRTTGIFGLGRLGCSFNKNGYTYHLLPKTGMRSSTG